MEFSSRLKESLLPLGIPGVFVIAFLDSAALPLVGGPDAVVLLLSWQHPIQLPLIVLAAATGSTLGCLVIYHVGRAGGELALARFELKKRERVKEKINRNALWMVMVAVMAPPPFPTKLFMLAAGVVKMPRGRFTIGVLAGRSLRYFIEGYLGARFGDQAAEVLKTRYPIISLVVIVGVVLFIMIWRFRRPRESSVKAQAPVHRD